MDMLTDDEIARLRDAKVDRQRRSLGIPVSDGGKGGGT